MNRILSLFLITTRIVFRYRIKLTHFLQEKVLHYLQLNVS